jgi:hypothetical protein
MLFAALAIVALAAPASPASAQTVDPARVAAAQKAAATFVGLAAGSHKSGQAPRQSDPKVKALLDAVFDLSALPTNAVLPMSELNRVNEWQKAILDVGVVYILAGTGIDNIANIGKDPSIGPRTDKNGVDFAPEYGRYIDAQLGVTTVMLRMINAHLAANPGDRAKFGPALGQIFGGAAQQMAGAITTLAIPDHVDAWRKQRLPVMLALAPPLAQGADPSHAKELNGMALRAAGSLTDPEVQAALKKVAGYFGG